MELLTSGQEHVWPNPANIAEFTHSKLSHFRIFRGLPFKSFNVGDPDPALCDLKVYQDYLVYCFVRRNIPPGGRILEVGGGDSRVLKFFSRQYECWNIDKCEGLGNGPVMLRPSDYKIVYDYMGSFNPAVPDTYFDLVYSISALEHTPEDPGIRGAIPDDIDRVLKPGGLSFHCFDILLRPGASHWINGLIPHLYGSRAILNRWQTPEELLLDPDLYHMSKAAYNDNWRPIMKLPWNAAGFPVSYNLLWRKPFAV